MPRFVTPVTANDNNHIMLIRMDNAKIISQLLKAVNFKDNATFCCTNNGVKVTIEDMKSVQLNTFIETQVFQSYILKEDPIMFKLNLSVLLECLNVFGSSIQTGTTPALKMCYAGTGSPLTILLEEYGVITDCKIRTIEFEPVLDYDFASANVVSKIIMNSECLKEIFAELDATSETVQFTISSNSPYLRMTTFGVSGTYHVDIPKDSDVIELHQCIDAVSFKYKLSLLKPSIKPLGISQKVSLRIDDTGLLCLQFMIKTEENHNCFIEFFCPANVDSDDED